MHLSSLLLGNAAAMTQCCIEYLELPAPWVDAVDKVCRDIKTCPRTLLCGAKGVGKSTCLRYTLNRHLSSKGKCVALLDCDLGQSEFNVSGLVSLHILSSPILSPSHLRLRTPELSFFIGDTTVKTDPGLFESALTLLYERYLVLRDRYAATGDVAGLSSYNPPSATGEGSMDTSGHSCAGGSATNSRTGFGALDDSPFSKFSLPLVVNTDGWIKSMGLEVLTTIIATTQPSHVIHLCTDKNKDLPALYQLGARPSLPKGGGAPDKPSGDGSSSEFAGDDDDNFTAKIFTLKPVRNTASKIAAVDLRNLRLVAYFLRDSPLLKGQQYPPLSEADAMKATSSTIRNVLIRNGSLVDPHGLLALALRESNHEQRLPFEQAVLRMIGPVIAPRLVLAAMNLSLVGVTHVEKGTRRTPTCIRIPSYVMEQLKYPQGRGDKSEGGISQGAEKKEEPQEEVTTFSLDCCGNSCILAPCQGLGIVSDVDLLQQCLHVITPASLLPSAATQEEDALCSSSLLVEPLRQGQRQCLESTSDMCIVRGNMQIPTTLLYCISDCGLCTPYLSSESCGEGSGKVTGARMNLKRRGQQQ